MSTWHASDGNCDDVLRTRARSSPTRRVDERKQFRPDGFDGVRARTRATDVAVTRNRREGEGVSRARMTQIATARAISYRNMVPSPADFDEKYSFHLHVGAGGDVYGAGGASFPLRLLEMP